MNIELSIIIVNWHSSRYVRQCLKTIRDHFRNIPHEIIVVDNASYDGCDELIEKEYPWVKYIQSERNHGFARANNLGVESAQGELLLFLNPDTEILDSALSNLMEVMRATPDAGIAGGKLLNSDLSVQTSCIQRFPTLVNQLLDIDLLRAKYPGHPLWGTGPLYDGSDQPVAVEVISGACIMIKRDVFEKVGRFSTDYFMYTEDIDLCHKVRRAGYKAYYCPKAQIVHHGGGSSSQQGDHSFGDVMMRESIYRYLCKTRGTLYASLYKATMIPAALVRLLALAMAAKIPVNDETRAERIANAKHRWKKKILWAAGIEKISPNRD